MNFSVFNLIQEMRTQRPCIVQTKVCLSPAAPRWDLTFSPGGFAAGTPRAVVLVGAVVQSPFSELNNDLAEINLVAEGFLVESWDSAHSVIYQMLML